MSTTYEVDSTQQTTTTTSSSDGIGFDSTYPRTVPAILKIVEIVLCLITFICASANYAFSCCYGGGWVQFVAMSALITTLLFFIFHMFRVIRKLPGPWVFIEFVYYCVYVLLFFIAAIVALAMAAKYHVDAIIATCVFSIVTLAVYAVDLFFQFRNWQASRHQGGSGTSTTTTTTTHTTYETRTQY